MKATLTTGLHEYLFNRPLQEAMQRNLEAVGAPKFGETEQRFARDLQRELGLPETGIDTTVRALAQGLLPPEGGSTDVSRVRDPLRACAPASGASVIVVPGAMTFTLRLDFDLPTNSAFVAFQVPESAAWHRARRISEPWRRHLTGRLFILVTRSLALDGIADTPSPRRSPSAPGSGSATADQC